MSTNVQSAKRVTVFIDEENVYRRARKTFDQENSNKDVGRVDALKLSELLVERMPPRFEGQRQLEEVRVYTGIPNQQMDFERYKSFRSRTAIWEKQGCVVKARRLRYSDKGPPRQKGVDVQLAVDVVRLAVLGRLDVAIIVSTDTDLEPVLETFWELENEREQRSERLPVEVVAWQEAESRHSQRFGLRHELPYEPVWCHFLSLSDYESIKAT